MRKKIAVVGDKGSVLGFKAVGFEVFMTSTQQETRDTMQQLCRWFILGSSHVGFLYSELQL